MSTQPTFAGRSFGGKGHALLVLAGLGLAGAGLAAGLMLRSPASTAPEVTVAEQSNTAHAVGIHSGHAKAGANANTSTAQRAAERPPLKTQTAALCRHCGVVEGVRPVQHRGEGSGVGAVAGGVLGAVVGHQMGGGSGKTAMTVLGALGGGVAGNEVEKRTKTTTVYEVQVRMEDGSLRSFTSASSPTPGAPVTVDGQGFHVGHGSSSAQRVARTMS